MNIIMSKQKTLKGSFSLCGKGLHTGLSLTVTFNPAPENTGYKIQRIDLEGEPVIQAVAENVVETQRGTVLGKGDIRVSTIEHGMSALYALGIDNCLIQVNGPEFPILDGSAAPYVEKIQSIGIQEQNAEKDYYIIRHKIEVKDDNGSVITILPDEDFSITAMCSFESKFINSQFATLEKIAQELNEGGANVVVGSLDAAINWGRSNSLWSLTFGTSCCGIEFMAVGCARYDFSRFGFEVTRNSPRQADLIMCAGTITNKMAPVFKRLYDEMAEPKYVVAVGGCAISGGPFKKSYNVVRGISELVPVDVYIPGCPPRPEAILYGMMQLQRKVKVEKFFGGANHKMNQDEKELSMSKGGLRGLSNENLSDSEKLGHKEPIIVTEVPEDFDPQKGLTD